MTQFLLLFRNSTAVELLLDGYTPAHDSLEDAFANILAPQTLDPYIVFASVEAAQEDRLARIGDGFWQMWEWGAYVVGEVQISEEGASGGPRGLLQRLRSAKGEVLWDRDWPRQDRLYYEFGSVDSADMLALLRGQATNPEHSGGRSVENLVACLCGPNYRRAPALKSSAAEVTATPPGQDAQEWPQIALALVWQGLPGEPDSRGNVPFRLLQVRNAQGRVLWSRYKPIPGV